MTECPRCKGNGKICKSGFARSGGHKKQRWLCSTCNHHFIEKETNTQPILKNPVEEDVF